MTRHLCRLVVAASIAIAPTVASADPAASKSKLQAARSYVEAGLAAQRSGDYDTAIMLYHKAYEQVPHPVLLFNMAQAHRLAGRIDQALTLYRRYLRIDPKSREARTARELVAELEARQAADGARARRSEADDGAAGESGRGAAGASDDARGTPGDPAGRVADRDDADASGGGADAEEVATPPHSPPGATPIIDPTPRDDTPDRGRVGLPIARLDLGAFVTNRELSYDEREGFIQGPVPLHATGTALRIEGEIYPFALADRTSKLTGLGVALAYEKTLGLELRSLDNVESVPVDQLHIRIGPRFRTDIGRTLTLTLGLDYAGRRYLLHADRPPTNPDVPDVDYASLNPTVGIQLPVWTIATLFANLETMLTLDAGPISQDMSFGKSTVWGLGATAGVEVALRKEIRIRVLVDYSWIGVSFDLMNYNTAGRDADPATKDVYGATDRSLGIAATVGVAY